MRFRREHIPEPVPAIPPAVELAARMQCVAKTLQIVNRRVSALLDSPEYKELDADKGNYLRHTIGHHIVAASCALDRAEAMLQGDSLAGLRADVREREHGLKIHRCETCGVALEPGKLCEGCGR